MYTVNKKRLLRLLPLLALTAAVQACSTDMENWQEAQGPQRLQVEKVVTNGKTSYVVVRPGCPNWSDAADWTTDNRVSSNFGCATANNLGLMLADPADYAKGRSNGPLDGTYAATGVRKYHEDRIEPLLTESTGSSSSGE